MEGVKNELEFYSKFARPLIFALPEAKDRVLAASWVKKVKEDENTSEKLKTDYIKLLLFALQRRKLVGIFNDDPTKYETLEEFPDEYDLNTMAQELIETEQKERRSKIRRQLQGEMGDFPPYTTDISSDLREYVAAQDIPCFGVHCYYAISKDPITSWQNAEKGIFPKAAKSAVNTNSPLPAGSRDPDTCISCPGPEGVEPCSPGSPAEKRKKISKKLGNTPPVKPLVTGPQPEEDETRKPPTWSSNLIDVIDRPRSTTGAIPKLRSEKQIRKEKEKLGDFDSDIEEDYNEMERALKDFQRGEIREQRRKREKRSKADDLDSEESSDDQEEDKKGEIQPDLENFMDLNETEYEQELQEDSLLVQYFKDTINKRKIQKEADSLKENIRGTIPAQSGIPLTTPKPSVSPKRLKIFPPIYAFDENLARDTTKQTDTGSPRPTCSYTCSGRDADMDKIFQEAAAIAKLLEDDLEPDYNELDQSQPYEEEKNDDQPPPLPEPQAPPSEPIQRLTRGSPAAHKIFADVIPPLIDQLKPGGTGIDRPYPSEMSDVDKGMDTSMQISPAPPADEEYNYIDSLFEGDKKTASMVKKVSSLVSDVKQDQQISTTTTSSPPSPRSPKICSDQRSPYETRQPIAQPIQSPAKIAKFQDDEPFSTTKITQSSTRITTSIPFSMSKDRDVSQQVGESRLTSPRTPSPSKSSPSPDDRIFDFAKGYVAPKYVSPSGIGFESPPQFMSPGRGEGPSYKAPKSPPSKTGAPLPTSPPGERICPSARRRLRFGGDVDTDTFLAEAMARQQDLPPPPPEGKQISPSVRRRMKFRGMDPDTFLTEAMARQQDLPPLPPDYTHPQRVQTPPKKGDILGWESPERPSPITSTFRQRYPPSQMISMEATPPFYDSPKSDISGWESPVRPAPTTPTSFQKCPSSQVFTQGATPSFYDSPKSQVTPPFVAPISTSPNLFDTSMGSQYFSPPPISPGTSPRIQQKFDRVNTPPYYESPKSQATPPFAAAGFTSGNLFDTSPPASPYMSPEMRRLSPTQNIQPRRAQKGISVDQQSQRPSVTGYPSPKDEYGLPRVVQVSPLSKFDQYSRFYERYPDLQSPERRGALSSRAPSEARQVKNVCPSVKRMSIYDGDTDAFLAEAMARQQNLPPLPSDYPSQSMRTPPRTSRTPGWESPDAPWPKTPPYYSPDSVQMLDAIKTPPFYDSPKDQLTPPSNASGNQYFSFPPSSPDMSPGMRQMLDKLPEVQSFPRCKSQKGGRNKQSVGGGQKLSRRSAPLPTIAGSPPAQDQSDSYPGGDPNSQSQQQFNYRVCPQSSRSVAKGRGRRSSK